jgi:AcrR family transcriptional regulator
MEKKKSTKSKDRSATEEKLLSAAEIVFSQLGFKGATTRLIAKKADINLSLINRYFKGKYGLFISLIERKAIAHKSSELPYPPQESFEQELAMFGEHIISRQLKDKNLFKIVIGQFISDKKFLKKFRDLLPVITSNPHVEERLEKFVKNGEMTNEYPINKILDDIESHACCLSLFKVIIREIPEDEVLNDFKEFILRYAQSLKNS